MDNNKPLNTIVFFLNIALRTLSIIMLSFLIVLLVDQLSVKLNYSDLDRNLLSNVAMTLSLQAFTLISLNKRLKIQDEIKKVSFKDFIKSLGIAIIAIISNALIMSYVLKNNPLVSENEFNLLDSNLIFIKIIFPIILAPTFEELVFRLLPVKLQPNGGIWSHYFIPNTVFAIMHYNPSFPLMLLIAKLITSFLFGIVNTYIYKKHENISTPILIHIIHNGILIAASYL